MIQTSTGKGRKNKPVDVVLLQLLLNQVKIVTKDINGKAEYVVHNEARTNDLKVVPKLRVDGECVSKLVERIEIYQKAKKMSVVDGWISPRGKTLNNLLADAKVSTTKRMSYIRKQLTRSCGVRTIRAEKVVGFYEKQYSILSCESKEGLRYILKTAKTDSAIYSIPEFAYMLATTKHETAHTFRGIEEYGKGSGRPYGKEIVVTDPKTKSVYKNKYYGRGYVQLTWGYNYQRIDHQLGHGKYPNKNRTKTADFNKGFTISSTTKSIYLNPEKALNKENAYIGLVWGMQKGIYTSKKIGDYISGVKIDYINARRVINGTDSASEIASYAENFEIFMLI